MPAARPGSKMAAPGAGGNRLKVAGAGAPGKKLVIKPLKSRAPPAIERLPPC